MACELLTRSEMRSAMGSLFVLDGWSGAPRLDIRNGPPRPVSAGEAQMTGITDTLASYITSSRYEALPPEIRRQGVRAFVNWVGCAAGGSRDEAVERALEVFVEFNGAREATLVGRPEKLDALNAAFINSMSSNALMFHDTHFIAAGAKAAR